MTERTKIATAHAPGAIGPYSQAIRSGPFVFTSGQVALDPASGKIVDGGIKEQTTRVLENLKAVLEAAGTSFQAVVKTTVYLVDMNDFPALNEVYATYFKDPPPARSTVEVRRLPRDAKVEIDVIAFVG